MVRSCPMCGEPFASSRPSAKFCSDRCRQRNKRGSAPVPAKPIDTKSEETTRLVQLVSAELERAGKLDSPLGEQAVQLAVLMTQPGGTQGGVAALSRELRSVLEVVLSTAVVGVDPLDELKARRDAKRTG